MTPFDLLLGELRAALPAEHFTRVCVVFESWGGERMSFRSKLQWRMSDAQRAARLMLLQGVERPAIFERLAVYSLSSRSVRRVVARAEHAVMQERHQQAQATAQAKAQGVPRHVG